MQTDHTPTTTATSQSADVPPAPPEAHQTADSLGSIFGDVVYAYTRAQALEDGFLVDVSEVAAEARFTVPVALTRALWEDCVAWADDDTKRQTYQDEAGRLWDVVYMASLAAQQAAARGLSEVCYSIYRVPRGGRGVRARLTSIKMVIGPGDAGEPVITLMQPSED